jgi:hypothetical protein
MSLSRSAPQVAVPGVHRRLDLRAAVGQDELDRRLLLRTFRLGVGASGVLDAAQPDVDRLREALPPRAPEGRGVLAGRHDDPRELVRGLQQQAGHEDLGAPHVGLEAEDVHRRRALATDEHRLAAQRVRDVHRERRLVAQVGRVEPQVGVDHPAGAVPLGGEQRGVDAVARHQCLGLVAARLRLGRGRSRVVGEHEQLPDPTQGGVVAHGPPSTLRRRR